MDRETYYKNYKVFFLYSSTITCIIIGLLLHYGRMIVVSDKVSSILSTLIILAGYILLLIIAKRLKKKDIHGLSNIVWATYLLFSQEYFDSLQGVWWSIVLAVETVIDDMMTKYSFTEHSQPIDSPPVQIDTSDLKSDIQSLLGWIKKKKKKMN